MLNYQPNSNQSATQFWNKFVNQLYDKNEVLIITHNKQLYIADRFDRHDENVLTEQYFSGVEISNQAIGKTYQMHEVYYFTLNNEKIVELLKKTTSVYKRLIDAAESAYIASNGRKGKLKIDQIAMNDKNFNEQMNQLLSQDFKKYYQSANAVLPLTKGYDYEELPSTNSMTTRDFRSLYNDVFEITAMAFGFPKTLLTGEVQDTTKAIEQLLTFVIDPLAKIIETEIDRKEYSVADIKTGGSYIKVDTKAINHIDLLDVATSVEKLISSGCFSINDIRVCGESPINEEWANKFFMTKNFAVIEDLLEAMKGGAEDEKGNNGTS